MKILVSAYACEPDCGSEPAIGWNVIRELSKRHDLHVLTRANHQKKILESNFCWVTQVTWHFIDPPRAITFWKKGRRGVALYYLLWQLVALQKAKKIAKETSFDFVHHLTFASVSPPSLLMNLGVPFTAGPLGGAEDPPEAYLKSLKRRERFIFWLRHFRRHLALCLFGGRKPYTRAAGCLAATEQGRQLLTRLGSPRCETVFQSGLSRKEMERLFSFRKSGKRSEGPIRLLIASRMIPWKAIDIAIDAVGKAYAQGLDFRLSLTETGPLERRLHQQIEKLGFEDKVIFLGRLPSHTKFLELLGEHDLLLHPALNEGFGQVCLEALALGIPVACLDWAGPGQIVSPDHGFLINVSSRTKMIEQFCDVLLGLDSDITNGSVSKRSLSRDELDQFSWKEICLKIERMWGDATPGFKENERR